MFCLGLEASRLIAASLTATLDRDVVPVGETVTLSLTFEGVSPPGAPSLPPLPNLNQMGVMQSSSVSIINGQTSARYSFNYSLVPTQPGDIQIPALQVTVGGHTLTSEPLKLRVVKPNPNTGADAGLNRVAFLRLVVPKAEVYVGEVFPVEIQLYFQSVEDVRAPQLRADGFSLGQATKPSQTTTRVNGIGYNLAVFKMSATAAKTGDLSFGPVECTLTVLLPTQRRRRDPFDPFGIFSDPVERHPTTLTSEAVAMRVLPLPTQNVPEAFNGAVGQFTMRVTAGPTNVAVGDPITVRVQISGNGALDALSLPAQPNWRDFKAYPPTSALETSDPLGLTGTKRFEQVVIPQNHEIKALPPVEFSYFDVAQRSYRILSNSPILLTVRHSAPATAPPPSVTNAPTTTQAPPQDDILHIKPRLDALGPTRPVFLHQAWFLSLQALPLLTWLSLLTWRKRTENLANNPRLRRQREVEARVRDGLRELQTQAQKQRSDDFFATLFRLLQERLGERLDLPASAITEAVIEERLRGRSLAEPTLTALHQLFQTCNQARYAPQKTSQELASLLPTVESVLRELEQIKA